MPSIDFFYLFGQYLPVLLAFLASVYLLVKRHTGFVAYSLGGSLLAAFIARIIRTAIYTPRPFVMMETEPLIPISPVSSFPSAHAAFSFALAFFFLKEKKLRRIGALLFVGVLITSYYRVLGLVHWPVDIFGGLLVGLFVNVIFSFAFKPKLK